MHITFFFILAAVAWAAGATTIVTGQSTETVVLQEPMRLEVLPKAWTRAQVELVMEAFNTSLGVECEYCHAEASGGRTAAPGEPPALDYASDAKEEKRVSRFMIQLVMDINTDLEDEIVSCYTCHVGKTTPALTPSTGWGRGRFTFTEQGPTVPPAESGR